MTLPLVLQTPEEVRAWRREAAGRVAFVPTMGYLHAGHERLLEVGRAQAETLVCSIFVNPTQFGQGEDLDAYPRDLEHDLAVCARRGVDVVFAPHDPRQLYPPGFQTWVEVTEVTRHFCGEARPGHFRGVTTIVTKLFNLVRPDVAVFGEKDFQQLATIRRMVRDLDLDIEILGVPTVREADGLALSSRNAYLDAPARARALALWQAIQAAQEAFASGERGVGALRRRARQVLDATVDAVDYLAIADPETLEPLADEAEAAPESRLLLAAFVDSGTGRRTRLIDNAPLAP
ncbi:MAG: pantoate--beta-alanine ligase [Deltaproteobacteria bacterium]|nr:MAG: pantoate--beta-alanine ligase [Deltaproteobacteria bacterium]